MAFKNILFPIDISYGATGGPGFSTDEVEYGGGNVQTNANWGDLALCQYDVAHAGRISTKFNDLLAFFRIVRGKANSFRYEDPMDHQCLAADGLLGTIGVGTGLPQYQAYKTYTFDSESVLRKLILLVSGTETIYRNGSPVAVGAGAGNIAIDDLTGFITFVPDAIASASSITVGATTQVVLPTNPGTLTAGKLLYLTGFTGADAALVNGLAHAINSISGTGPYTFTLATNTAGKTITLGSGEGKKYPQATDALTIACDFHVKCKFGIDNLRAAQIIPDGFSWSGIPILEQR